MDRAVSSGPARRWILVDVVGFTRPAAVVPGPRGWRVRLLGLDPYALGEVVFFGLEDASGSEASFCVTFGEFSSVEQSLEFLSILSSASPVQEGGGSAPREMPMAVPPESAARDVFCPLEGDSDPSSSARRAMVLLFAFESPDFHGRVADALAAAKRVPVMNDVPLDDAVPAPVVSMSGGSISNASVVPMGKGARIVGAAGGIDVVLSLSPDEEMSFPDRPRQAGGDRSGVAPFSPSSVGSVGKPRVRRMGVLSADQSDEVASVLSSHVKAGAVKLVVDELVDEAPIDKEISRRSFHVFTVTRPGVPLGNSRLRKAVLEMMRESDGRKGSRLVRASKL